MFIYSSKLLAKFNSLMSYAFNKFYQFLHSYPNDDDKCNDEEILPTLRLWLLRESAYDNQGMTMCGDTN